LAFGGDYPGCIFFYLSRFWAAWGTLQETRRIGCVTHTKMGRILCSSYYAAATMRASILPQEYTGFMHACSESFAVFNTGLNEADVEPVNICKQCPGRSGYRMAKQCLGFGLSLSFWGSSVFWFGASIMMFHKRLQNPRRPCVTQDKWCLSPGAPGTETLLRCHELCRTLAGSQWHVFTVAHSNKSVGQVVLYPISAIEGGTWVAKICSSTYISQLQLPRCRLTD
jgi:hypothetical protein